MYQNHVTNILRHYLREQQIPINRWDNFGDIVSSGVWWDYVSEVNSHLKWLPFINFRILNDFFLLWLFTIIILIAIRTYVIHRNINWCDKSYFKSLLRESYTLSSINNLGVPGLVFRSFLLSADPLQDLLLVIMALGSLFSSRLGTSLNNEGLSNIGISGDSDLLLSSDSLSSGSLASIAPRISCSLTSSLGSFPSEQARELAKLDIILVGDQDVILAHDM